MMAELEITLLHDKMNLLREEEVVQIIGFLVEQQAEIKQLKALLLQKLNSQS
jgi:uncharacterized small protein (DUF1192 family)